MAGHSWDERFAGDDYAYGTEPNTYLRAQAWRLRPGMNALSVADGEGRNGVWLAGQGLDVLSVDSSAVGLAKAQRLAVDRGVRLTTVQADLLEWQWGRDAFDLIASIYMHFAPEVRPRMHRAMIDALRPGGLVLIEAFHKRQPGRGAGSPVYQPDALQNDFADLQILELLVGTVTLDEGTFHRGPAEVVRFLGRRPD